MKKEGFAGRSPPFLDRESAKCPPYGHNARKNGGRDDVGIVTYEGTALFFLAQGAE